MPKSKIGQNAFNPSIIYILLIILIILSYEINRWEWRPLIQGSPTLVPRQLQAVTYLELGHMGSRPVCLYKRTTTSTSRAAHACMCMPAYHSCKWSCMRMHASPPLAWPKSPPFSSPNWAAKPQRLGITARILLNCFSGFLGILIIPKYFFQRLVAATNKVALSVLIILGLNAYSHVLYDCPQ